MLTLLITIIVAVSSAGSASLPSPTLTLLPLHSKLSLTSATPAWCEESLASLKPRYTPGLDWILFSALIAGQSVICYPLSSTSTPQSHLLFFPDPGNVVGLSPEQRW